MSAPRVAILGGGPAGCGAAYRVHHLGVGRATLLEQSTELGGNAGSFDFAGQRVDYGSHRLHSACDPTVLADIERLLDGDLARRERHGRIRLLDRWIHFPLKTTDLLLRLDRKFAAGALVDMIGRRRPPAAGVESFASVLQAGLGPTICETFYFPYARKIWGAEPDELSAMQARKRVSASSFSKLIGRLLRPSGRGYFYYPGRGYGQISEAFAAAASELGAAIQRGWRVTRLQPPANGNGPWVIDAATDGATTQLEADHVWSTLPLTVVARLLDPPPPTAVATAASAIDYRSMVLVYLVLGVDRFSATDAHYFPAAEVAMTRLSEPKNYSGRREPAGSTVLCAELPCSTEDAVWSLSDEELGHLVAADMERAGLPPAEPLLDVGVRRLRHAYPIYRRGYERPLAEIENWLEALPCFVSFGRQGLFTHDNTHHALFMAYCAGDCLGSDGVFDGRRWLEYRQIFDTHVVED